MAFSLRGRREPSRGRYTPKLWPVWGVAPLVLLVAAALSFVLYHLVYDLLDQAARSQRPYKPVNSNDVIKTTVTVLTLIGAVLAGIYAYRKQLLAEGDAHRSDASQLAERYTAAAEQLGHGQAAVRLAGVYALARLADDWEEQRQVCIDVLCAYLRMPYQPDPTHPGHKEGEREVRHTIIPTIGDHLQQPDAPTSWCANSFDFTGATFDGGNFSGRHFIGKVTFYQATFSSGVVVFHNATFGGDINFIATKFSGSTVHFDEVKFSGGTINFNGAKFSRSNVRFMFAKFSDSTVSFDMAEISGGMLRFDHAEFIGGSVSFSRATLGGGTVHFDGATLGGAAITWGPVPRPTAT